MTSQNVGVLQRKVGDTTASCSAAQQGRRGRETGWDDDPIRKLVRMSFFLTNFVHCIIEKLAFRFTLFALRDFD